MKSLTREEILALDDIDTKEIIVPAEIRNWGGTVFIIKQLTRGDQDDYLRRQFGTTKVKQNPKNKTQDQEIGNMSLYGHDAWLCVRGIVDDKGMPVFLDKDIDSLNRKNGQAIGWIAKQIIEFSGMQEDIKDLDSMESDIKKS